VWREFRRELVRQGYSSSVLRKNKHNIMAYVKELGDRGILDDIGENLEQSASDSSEDVFEDAELPVESKTTRVMTEVVKSGSERDVEKGSDSDFSASEEESKGSSEDEQIVSTTDNRSQGLLGAKENVKRYPEVNQPVRITDRPGGEQQLLEEDKVDTEGEETIQEESETHEEDKVEPKEQQTTPEQPEEHKLPVAARAEGEATKTMEDPARHAHHKITDNSKGADIPAWSTENAVAINSLYAELYGLKPEAKDEQWWAIDESDSEPGYEPPSRRLLRREARKEKRREINAYEAFILTGIRNDVRGEEEFQVLEFERKRLAALKMSEKLTQLGFETRVEAEQKAFIDVREERRRRLDTQLARLARIIDDEEARRERSQMLDKLIYSNPIERELARLNAEMNEANEAPEASRQEMRLVLYQRSREEIGLVEDEDITRQEEILPSRHRESVPDRTSRKRAKRRARAWF